MSLELPQPVRLTEQDRRAIGHLSTDWRAAPPCFTPNALCREQETRGLLEIRRQGDRYHLRLTELGAELIACKGEA